MVHIKLLKDWNGYTKGCILAVKKSIADKLVEGKSAKYYISNDPEKIKAAKK